MYSQEQIIFLISLPRSGSTLLQRILSTDASIVTLPETWLLLPLYHIDCNEGVYADYGHVSAANAIRELTERLPGGATQLEQILAATYLRVISEAAESAGQFFLEKTPRNTLIVDRLIRAFPKSKFIFLWRNPLAVLNSISQEFGRGEWKVYKHRIDLYEGLESMVRAYRADSTRFLSLQYESLVTEPESCLASVASYLGVDLKPNSLQDFTGNLLPGRMGDPSRDSKYTQLSRASRDKWKTDLNTPIRRMSARRYARWIVDNSCLPPGFGAEDLRIDRSETSLNAARWLRDLFYSGYGYLDAVLELNQLRAYRSGSKRPIHRRHY